MPKNIDELTEQELREILEIEENELAGLNTAKEGVDDLLKKEKEEIAARKEIHKPKPFVKRELLDLNVAKEDHHMRVRLRHLLKKERQKQAENSNLNADEYINISDFKGFVHLQNSGNHARESQVWQSKEEKDWLKDHNKITDKNRDELTLLARPGTIDVKRRLAKEAASLVPKSYDRSEALENYKGLFVRQLILKDEIKGRTFLVDDKPFSFDFADLKSMEKKDPAKYKRTVAAINSQLPEGKKLYDYFELVHLVKATRELALKDAEAAKDKAGVDWIKNHTSDARKDYSSQWNDLAVFAERYSSNSDYYSLVVKSHDADLEYQKARIARELIETEKLNKLVKAENETIQNRNKTNQERYEKEKKESGEKFHEKQYLDECKDKIKSDEKKVILLKANQFVLGGIRDLTHNIGNFVTNITDNVSLGIVKGVLQSEENKVTALQKEIAENELALTEAGRSIAAGQNGNTPAYTNGALIYNNTEIISDRTAYISELKEKLNDQIKVRDEKAVEVTNEIKVQLDSLTKATREKAEMLAARSDLLSSRDMVESDLVKNDLLADGNYNLKNELKISSIAKNESERMRIDAKSKELDRSAKQKRAELDAESEKLKTSLTKEKLDSYDKLAGAVEKVYKFYQKVKSFLSDDDEKDEPEEQEDIDIREEIKNLTETANKLTEEPESKELIKKSTQLAAKAGQLLLIVSDKLNETVTKVNEELERAQAQEEADRGFLKSYDIALTKNEKLSIYDHKLQELEQASNAAKELIDARIELVSDSIGVIKGKLNLPPEKENEKEVSEEPVVEQPEDVSKQTESEKQKLAREEFESALKELTIAEENALESTKTVDSYASALGELKSYSDALKEGQKRFNEKLTQQAEDVKEKHSATIIPETTENPAASEALAKDFTSLNKLNAVDKYKMEAEIDKIVRSTFEQDKDNTTKHANDVLRVSSLSEYRDLEMLVAAAKIDALQYAKDKSVVSWITNKKRMFYSSNLDWSDQKWNKNKLGIEEYSRNLDGFNNKFREALEGHDGVIDEQALAEAAVERYRALLARQLSEKNKIKKAIAEANQNRKEKRKEQEKLDKEYNKKSDQKIQDKDYEKELKHRKNELNTAGVSYYATHLANLALKTASDVLGRTVATAAEAQIKAPGREMDERLKKLQTEKTEIEKATAAAARNSGSAFAVINSKNNEQIFQNPALITGVARNTAEMNHLIRRRDDTLAEIRGLEKDLELRRVQEESELSKCRQDLKDKMGIDLQTVRQKSGVSVLANTARGEAVLKMVESGEITQETADMLLRSVNLSQTSAMTEEAMELSALHDQDEMIKKIGEASDAISACFTEKGKNRINTVVAGAKALKSLIGMIVGDDDDEEEKELNIRETLDGAIDKLDKTIASMTGEDGEEKEYTVDNLIEMAHAWQDALDTFRENFDKLERDRYRRYDNKRRLKDDAERMYDQFRDRDEELSAPEFMDEQANMQRARVNEITDVQIDAYQRAENQLQEDLNKAKTTQEECAEKLADARKLLEEKRAAYLKSGEEELRAQGASEDEIQKWKAGIESAGKAEEKTEAVLPSADEQDPEKEAVDENILREQTEGIVKRAEEAQQAKEAEQVSEETVPQPDAVEGTGDNISELSDDRLKEIRNMERSELSHLNFAKVNVEKILLREEEELQKFKGKDALYLEECKERSASEELRAQGLAVKRLIVNAASGLTGYIGSSLENITDKLKLGIIKGVLQGEENKVNALKDEIDENEKVIVAVGREMSQPEGADAASQNAVIHQCMEVIRDRNEHINVLKDDLAEQIKIRDEKEIEVTAEVKNGIDEIVKGQIDKAAEKKHKSDILRQRDRIESVSMNVSSDNYGIKQLIQTSHINANESVRMSIEAEGIKLDAAALAKKKELDEASEKLKKMLTPENLDTVDKVAKAVVAIYNLYQKVKSALSDDDDEKEKEEEEEEEFDLDEKIKGLTEAAEELNAEKDKIELVKKGTALTAKAGQLLLLVSGKLDDAIKDLDDDLSRTRQRAAAQSDFLKRYEENLEIKTGLKITDFKAEDIKQARVAVEDTTGYRKEVLHDAISAIEEEMKKRGILREVIEAEIAEKHAKEALQGQAEEKEPESKEHRRARKALEKAIAERDKKLEEVSENERAIENYTKALDEITKQNLTLTEGRKIFNDAVTKQIAQTAETHNADRQPETPEINTKDFKFYGVAYLATHIANSALKHVGDVFDDAVLAAAEAQIKAPGRELESQLKDLMKKKADLEKTAGATSEIAGVLLDKVRMKSMDEIIQTPDLLRNVSSNTNGLAQLFSEHERISMEIVDLREKLEAQKKVEATELQKCREDFRNRLGFDEKTVRNQADTAAYLNGAKAEIVLNMLENKEISQEEFDTLSRVVNLSQSAAMSAEAAELHALHDKDETIQTVNKISDTLSACFTEKGKGRIDMMISAAKALKSLAVKIFGPDGGGSSEELDIKKSLDSALEKMDETIASLSGQDGKEKEHTIDDLVEMAKAWKDTLHTFQTNFEKMERINARKYENKKIIQAAAERHNNASKTNEILEDQLKIGERAQDRLQAKLDNAKNDRTVKAQELESAESKIKEARERLEKLEHDEIRAREAEQAEKIRQAKTVAEAAAELAIEKQKKSLAAKVAKEAAEEGRKRAAEREVQRDKEKKHLDQLEKMLSHKDDDIKPVDYELDNDGRNGAEVVFALTGVDPRTAGEENIREALRRINVNGLPAATYFRNELAGVTDIGAQAERVGEMLKTILHNAADPENANKVKQTVFVENENYFLARVRLKNSVVEHAKQKLMQDYGMPVNPGDPPQKPENYNKAFHGKESRAYDEEMVKYQEKLDHYKEVQSEWDAFHEVYGGEESAITKYNRSNRLAENEYNASRLEAAKKEFRKGKEKLQEAVMINRGVKNLPKENVQR